MTSAPFRVSLEESHAILRKVLPLMSERRVPAVPQNYTVWYDYVVGKNEALSLEPGRMLEDCAEFSPEVCQTVYERFYVDQLRAEVVISGTPSRLISGNISTISSVAPEFDTARTTSLPVIMPRSP